MTRKHKWYSIRIPYDPALPFNQSLSIEENHPAIEWLEENNGKEGILLEWASSSLDSTTEIYVAFLDPKLEVEFLLRFGT